MIGLNNKILKNYKENHQFLKFQQEIYYPMFIVYSIIKITKVNCVLWFMLKEF